MGKVRRASLLWFMIAYNNYNNLTYGINRHWDSQIIKLIIIKTCKYTLKNTIESI